MQPSHQCLCEWEDRRYPQTLDIDRQVGKSYSQGHRRTLSPTWLYELRLLRA